MSDKPPIASKYWKQIPATVQAVILELLRSLWSQIDQLKNRTDQLKEKNEQLRKENKRIRDDLEKLRRQVDSLKERLGKNSTNSSKPPSSDGPKVKRPPPKGKSGRKRGGQPGHSKRQREMVPSEQCSEVLSVKPEACKCCGQALQGEDPKPARHQVWELPEIQPSITEYQLHTLGCACGAKTTARLPAGVPRGNFGPRLISLVALLIGV